jgi:hypothetical protein
MRKTHFWVFFLTFQTLLLISAAPLPKPEFQSMDSSGMHSAATDRSLLFSGYNWTVRSSENVPQGPGPNSFNESADSVWVDGDGFLHLKIRNYGGIWYCAEVYTNASFGYGTYLFKVHQGFENLDVNVVLGLFTYYNDTQEIDIEFARWGDSQAENGQYVVQPYSESENLHHFEMPLKSLPSTHGFDWCEEYIEWFSLHSTDFGLTTWDPSAVNWNNLVQSYYYQGDSNPLPRTERVHMNLWLMQGLAPTDAQEVEVVIEEFRFIPSGCDTPLFPPISGYDPILLCLTVLSSIAIVYTWKRKRVEK